MSWSVTATGTAEEIGKQFDAVRDQAAANGMIEPEQRDIDEARNLAIQLASSYGRVTVSATGHWTVYGADDPRNTFGQVSVTIAAARLAES